MKVSQTGLWLSPLGLVRISAAAGLIVECRFVADGAVQGSVMPAADVVDEAVRQLAEYFSGRRHRFDLPLDRSGDSVFQHEVWTCLDRLAPYGTTVTYGAIAAELGRPGAARAVARVMACNRFHVVRPCHRVVASGGKLGGYAAGCDVKRALLMSEGVAPAHAGFSAPLWQGV